MTSINKQNLLNKIASISSASNSAKRSCYNFVLDYDSKWDPKVYPTGEQGIELNWEIGLEDSTILCGLEFDKVARVRYFWFFSDDTEGDDMEVDVLFKNYMSIGQVIDYVQADQKAYT